LLPALAPFELHGRIPSSAAADAITLYLRSTGGGVSDEVGSAASADIVGADVVGIVCGRWMIGVRSIVGGVYA
jgi:hypothetical protein